MPRPTPISMEARDPATEGAASQAVVARTYAWLFGSGATLVLLTLLLPGAAQHAYLPGIVAPPVVAYAVVALMLLAPQRVQEWGYALLPAGGSVLVSLVLASSSPAGVSGYAMLYFYVVLAAFYFFTRRWAYVNLALVAVSYAGVVAVRGDVPGAAVKLVMAGGAMAVAGSLITNLRARVDGLVQMLRATARRQGAVAALGERALEGADPAGLERLAEAAVRDCLGVDACEIAADPATRRYTVRVDRPLDDGEKRFLRSLGTVLSHASARHSAAEELHHRARHDLLTGLPNRSLFEDQLAEATERALVSGRGLAVLFVDLDGFKLINDGFGHATGDELLTALVPRLRAPLFATDTLARFGGDEFVVLCEGVDPASALEMAEALRAAASQPLQLAHHEHRGTVSVGVAMAVGDDVDVDTLLRDADTAMYEAKALGGDRCVLFDDPLREGVMTRVRVEHALRGALERDELSLVYQPVVSLPAGEIVAAEALLRWTHGELGAVSPAEFIPLAEDLGLIVPIGRWVLAQACRRLVEWQSMPAPLCDLTVNVNVSARQLAEADFVETVAAVLAQTGAPADRLALEVTETALADDPRRLVAHLEALRRLGVRIVLDDFGTGYSSLSYLDRLPLDSLKVDRSFVARLGEDRQSEAIISAVAGIGRAFGMRLVAEGVETAEQAEVVQALGCGFAQGYFFSRPVPAAELVARYAPPLALAS